MFTAPTLIEGNTAEPPREDSEQETTYSNSVRTKCVDQNELSRLKKKYIDLEEKYNTFIYNYDLKTEELELLLEQCLN